MWYALRILLVVKHLGSYIWAMFHMSWSLTGVILEAFIFEDKDGQSLRSFKTNVRDVISDL